MAGVQLNKTTIKSLSSMKSHFDEKARATNNHKNNDIDKSKSGMNYNLGASSWREMMKACKEEIKKQDQEHPPKRKKADRKDAYSFIIYCPNEIENDREFFKKIYEKFEQAYPGSLKGMQVHIDEQHEYIDPNSKERKMSMKHAHCFGVPIDEVLGCNMKNFANQDFFVKVNAICEEAAKEMGAKYHTGEGHHKDRDIDYMKMESSKALEEKVKEQEKTISTNEEVLDFQMQAVVNLDKEIEELESKKVSVIEKIKQAIQEFLNLKNRQKTMEKSVPEIKKDKVFGTANQIKKLGEKEIKSIYDKIGIVEAPESDLRAINKKYEETLDDIKLDENTPIKSTYEPIPNQESYTIEDINDIGLD